MSEHQIMTSEAVIDAIVRINCTHYSERNRAAFRQALVSLVELVRAEQVLEIQRDMNQATRAMYGG